MRRALVIYAVVVVLGAWAVGIAALLLQDKLGPWAGFIMLPMVIVPFVMAYVGQRIAGAVGNPFRGLVFGSFGWFALIWFAGLLLAGLAAALCFGLNIASFDTGMTDYIAMMKDIMATNGQNAADLPANTLKTQGWITAGASLVIGPFIGALFGCLATFPHFGWFGRRVLVSGMSTLFIAMIALYALSGIPAGMIENPQLGDYGLLARLGLTLVGSVCSVPALLWVFFRTRSAVMPALAIASYQSGWAGIAPFISDHYTWLVGQQSVVAAGVLLAAGIGLWFLKDPGGQDLAVAAVAFDGTPLTPEQAAAYESGEHHDVEHLVAEVGQQVAPPPGTAAAESPTAEDPSDTPA